MRQLREQDRKEHVYEPNYNKGYIPLTFEAMINHVYTTTERNNVREKINLPTLKSITREEGV
jgi:hypothetical protein